MDSKACTKCGAVKPLSEFHKRKDSKDGFSHCCKICKKQLDLEYRAINLGKIKKYDRERSKEKNLSLKHKEQHKLHRERNRDRYRNIRKSQVKNLCNSYVAMLLVKNDKFTKKEITPELIELKKEQLEMMRLSRQLKKAAKENNAQPN